MHSIRPHTGLRAALIALASLALQASGFALTVTNNYDYTPSQTPISGSLRYAIANTASGGSVTFSSSMKGKTIALTGGQLVVNKTLTITGPGCKSLTVSGNNCSRVFYTSGTNANPSLVAVTISDITITKGNGVGPDLSGFGNDANGGAIQNVGSLQLLRCPVTNSKALLGSGGAIYNRGTIALTECTVSYSRAGLNGGGIYDEQDMTITRSTISNNNATIDGGGIQESGTVTLINSTIAANCAIGAGGGFSDSGSATLDTYNVTIAGNTAAIGGGLAHPDYSGASWELRNTIVADNCALIGPDISNAFAFSSSPISLGKNLVENTNGFPSSNLIASDLRNVDPKLGPLQNNGGPTFTMALRPGSPAIDKGSNANLLPSMTTDQRAFIARIINGGMSNTVDIGAYEYCTAKALKCESINDANRCANSTDCNTRSYGCTHIRSLQCSTSDRLWQDPHRLNCYGEVAFDYEADAAYSCQKIIACSLDILCVKSATDAVQDLLCACEQIARGAIDDARAAHGSNYYLSLADAEMASAQTCIAAGDYKGAVEHYGHGWEYAQKACGNDRSDDQCRQYRSYCDNDDRDRWGDDNRCYGEDDDDNNYGGWRRND
jgi:hypothetical protein